MLYIKRYVEFFESLNKNTSFNKYEEIFVNTVYFEDPFQKTKDLKSLYKIFMHMYETLHEAHFVVKEIALTNNIAYIQWVFRYKRVKNQDFESFIGVSRVTFEQTGKVVSHIDYWDSATNIYEKIPILGSLINFVKKRIKA